VRSTLIRLVVLRVLPGRLVPVLTVIEVIRLVRQVRRMRRRLR
jgi:hypothetical protein